ncbi:MAG: TetR family transcriptional regulator [Fimbriimonadia bacterium]|nr:TetR family transcriptional regulator [Fimbriimonadia bacterium]
MSIKTEKQEQRREQILQGAAKVFARKGYHATTVEEIARELGMTKASIYYYINDKSDLLYQLYRRAMELLLDSQAEIARRAVTADLQLKAMIEEYARIVSGSHAMFSVVVLREHHALSPKRRKEIIAMRDEYEANLRACIEQGIQESTFEPTDVKMAAYVVLGALNWIPTWYNPKGERAKEEIGAIFAERLVHGLMKQGDPHGSKN